MASRTVTLLVWVDFVMATTSNTAALGLYF